MRRNGTASPALIALMPAGLLFSLVGCYGGYADNGPAPGGQVYVDGGYGPGYSRDRGNQAFRAQGGQHPVAAASDRGRASMGSRGGDAGHGSAGGGHK